MKKLQFDYQELSALYEKDQTVWNEKFIVLEEQRDTQQQRDQSPVEDEGPGLTHNMGKEGKGVISAAQFQY